MSVSTAEFFDVDDDNGEDLLADLKEMVYLGAKELPRSQQADLGPSEVGVPCNRQLAYHMMDAPECRTYDDPLAALFGTGMHHLMDGFAHAANRRLGRIRWIPEQKVQCRPGGLSGTADLFDLDTLTVIDHKCPRATRFKKYTSVKHGPPLMYRRQVQIYGTGYERTFGIRPKRVGIFWLPQAGALEDARIWVNPYDPSIAEDTFARYDNLALVLHDLDIEHHPQRFELIPASPGPDCGFCDYHSANPAGPFQCLGNSKEEENDG